MTTILDITAGDDARVERDSLRGWLLDAAAPLWWGVGADQTHGGFHEKIDQDGLAVPSPKRLRVQPRQVYAYALIGKLGWGGPWRDAIEHGLDFIDRAYRRDDGLFRTVVSRTGAPIDDAVVLYDQAFVLFGWASAYRAMPALSHLPGRANDLLARLRQTLKHAQGGFEEAAPRTLPLLSNPHMHLFEASLAWLEATGDNQWRALADEIAQLALARFVDPKSGGLREFFDGDWRPAPGVAGRIVEPGHQFEWAWLLLRWSALTGRDDAALAAFRMIAIGDGPGSDPKRGVAINALLDTMTAHDATARLWPQTERIKAGVLAAMNGHADGWHTALAGAHGLKAYLDTPILGLWFDRMDEAGALVQEPAPASSFYHIACAIAELDQACG